MCFKGNTQVTYIEKSLMYQMNTEETMQLKQYEEAGKGEDESYKCVGTGRLQVSFFETGPIYSSAQF